MSPSSYRNAVRGLGLVLVLAAAMVPSVSAQGLGNGRDLRLRSSIGAGALNDGGKFYDWGNTLTLTLDSPGATLVGLPALIAVDLRAAHDQNVLVLPNEPAALGIGPAFFFLVEGTGTLPAVFPGVTTIPPGGLTIGLPIPDLSALGPVSLYFQGTTFDAGATNGLAFTKTCRLDRGLLATANTLTATEYVPNTFFGYATWVADVNADGYADVLSGMTGAEPTGVFDSGEVRIYYGPNHTTTTSLWATVPQATAFFGGLVRTGDVTGDGIVDVIVGARLEDVSGQTDAGAVYVYPGPSFASGVRVTLPTPQAGSRFGGGLAVADWDHDGIDDLVVGAPRAPSTSGVTLAGKIYVFRGPTFSYLGAIDNPSPVNGDKFGDALIGADFTGDGRDDLFVGAPGKDNLPATDVGAAYLFAGGQTTPLVTLSQPADTDAELGNGFAAADMNKDGALDVVCGTEFADGTAVDSGQVQIVFGPTFTTRLYVNPPAGSVLGGFGSATAVGDANADGYPDLLVGEMYSDIGVATNAGRGWLLLGPSFEQSKGFAPHDPVTDGNFGRRAAMGDLDGDGFLDVIFSAPLADPGGVANNQEGSVYLFR